MRTKIEKKQDKIKKYLASLGWSRSRFADVLYEELYCRDDENIEDFDRDRIRRIAQNLQKHLCRTTTKEEILDKYLNVIMGHEDFKALNLESVMLTFVSHDILRVVLQEGLYDISVSLDNEQ
ncbi:hypothetical protein AB7X32_20965 [Morganella morganii]|uniref:hypothetical protein n=1 Tax=Morganella morganii TaxID=582 RepID=UPI0034E5C35B